jgi:hypothetical protein
MLPGVLASHSQNGSNDMGVVSDSGAQLDNIASSLKSTTDYASCGVITATLDDSGTSPPVAMRHAHARLVRRRFGRASALAVVGALMSTAFVATAASAGQPAAQPAAPRIAPSPVATMSDLMVKIIYPASDAIFYITTREPTSDAEWIELQGKALMVAESANLLMMPAHMRDEDRWLTDAKLMRDAGTAAFKAAKAKDLKALDELNDALYQSCVTCHMHYRPSYGRGR